MIPKLRIELINYYTFLGWILVLAGLMGGLFCLTNPADLEAVLGFSLASIVCGALMIYLGVKKKRVFKKR